MRVFLVPARALGVPLWRDVLLYDLTSTFDPPFAGKRQFGYSRDILEGFPLAYEVMSDNTSDEDHVGGLSGTDRAAVWSVRSGLDHGSGGFRRKIADQHAHQSVPGRVIWWGPPKDA